MFAALHRHFIVLLTAMLIAAAACAPASAPPNAPPGKEKAAEAVAQPTATQAPAPDLTEAMLKNARYELRDLGAFQLQDGRYEQKYGEGATQVNSVAFQRAAFGDLDGDKTGDAAVTLAWNSGGSGTFINLAAVLNRGGVAQQAAAELLGDRVQVKSLSIAEGKILVEMVGFGPNDPLCCPSQEMTRTYRLQDRSLVQVP